MKQKRFILNKAGGYTLLELLLVISLTGVMVLVIGSSYVQIMKGRVNIAQRSVAMADLDSSAHWLTRDLVMSQNTTLTLGAPPTSNMTLGWLDKTSWAIDEGTTVHSVNYALSGTRLLRNYDGNVTIVSRYLTTANFSITGNVFTITLTSRPGQPGSAVTRSLAIGMRFEPGQ
jgi:type II secretory pathway pseudopilin PulG